MDINKLRKTESIFCMFLLLWAVYATLAWETRIESCLMDPLSQGRTANLEREGSPAFSSSPSGTSARRLSAAGRASKLKEKNLIPPLNSPTDRRISLPRASKTPSNSPASSKKTVKPPLTNDMPTGKAPPEPSVLEDIRSLISGVRTDIASSEERMSKRFDDLSVKLSARIDKTEAELSSLGTQVARTRAEIEATRKRVDDRDKTLPQMIEQIVNQKLETGGRPTPRGGRGQAPRPLRAPDNSVERAHRSRDLEHKYYEARRSLRIWPVAGENLAVGVKEFLIEKLLCGEDVNLEECTIRRVNSASDSEVKNQVVVTFPSIAMRDEIKSLGRNLRGGGRATGLQIEPPDHLRGQYQSFQKLAFQLKKKNPQLRRNVEFLDSEQCLTMDVCLSPTSPWKTIEYVDAKTVLSKARVRTESFSLNELQDLVEIPRKRRWETLRDTDESDDDENDETIIDLTDMQDNVNNNEKKDYVPSLSFINTNSRSLGAKLESLADCFHEKKLDFASITETWLQDGRDLGVTVADLEDEHGLAMITRNRNLRANNGRQYGGVSLVFKKKNANFKLFSLQNPENYEVLACVGRVHGNKGKVAIVTCYAPPNIPSHRAQSLVDYISDVVGELKRKFPDVTLVISGDFNQWSIAELIADHPDLSEVNYGPTRGDRAID